MSGGKPVVVAMSGGVDSSLSAALLQEEGREVIGVTMRFPEPEGPTAGAASCCGQGGATDASVVCARLDIPFYTLDCRAAFEEQVIAPFCRAYLEGRTPNPCILCNTALKFGLLLNAALAGGAESVATGHYARVVRDAAGRPRLAEGVDAERDQSYFLYPLAPDRLGRAEFPIGARTKAQVRAEAARRGLPVADKPASQDICFVGAGGYRRMVRERHPGAARPGPIFDGRGRLLGEHSGLSAYTVGQRRGLGIADGEPLYVTALDQARNAVVVGRREELFVTRLYLEGVCWHEDPPEGEALPVEARCRHRAARAPARVTAQGDRAVVEFVRPQPRVAAGQAVVLYRKDIVVAGGVACLLGD